MAFDPSNVSAILAAGDINKNQQSPVDIMAKWQGLTNQQTENASKLQQMDTEKLRQQQLDLENTNKKIGMAGGIAMVAANDPGEMTPERAEFYLKTASDMGLAPDKIAVIRTHLSADMTSDQRKDVFRTIAMSSTGNAKGSQDLMRPTFTSHDTGQGIVTTATPPPGMPGANQPVYTGTGPGAGQQPPTSGIPSGAPSNRDLSNIVEITDDRETINGQPNPNFGQPRKVVAGQIVPPGLQRPGPPGALPPIPGVTPPPAPATPPVPGAPGATAPNTGSPGVAAGLPPGVATSLADARKQSTEEGQTLVATDGPRPQTEALLSEILTAAANPKAFTGKDAPAYVSLMQRLQQIPGVVDKSVLEGVGAQESMAKAMANLQTILMSGMIHTNEGLAHVIDQTPHMELTKIGLPGIVHQLQGTLAAQEAMSFAWQQSGLLPHEYQKWRQQFIAPSKDGQFDPRVFWWDKMNKDERGIFLRDVPDKARFDKNFQYAQKKGWVQ